jgi:nicotinamide riboside transporter PnuC
MARHRHPGRSVLDYFPNQHTLEGVIMVNPLGREPAQWIGLLSAAVALFSSLIFPLDIGQQGALIAVATAVFGIAGALAVSGEKAAPLVAGLVQSVLACALAFGLSLAPEVQGSIMAFVAAAVGWYLRTQVVAPAPAVVVAQHEA